MGFQLTLEVCSATLHVSLKFCAFYLLYLLGLDCKVRCDKVSLSETKHFRATNSIQLCQESQR